MAERRYLVLSMSEQMFEDLCRAAERELRDPKQQALWFIKRALDVERAVTVARKGSD